MGFQDLLELLKTPNRPKFYRRLRDDHVLDENWQARVVRPNKAYFEIQLAEMFLHNRSEYGRDFVPFTLVASEFLYGGKRQAFPFFVGNQLLRDVESYVKGQDVNYHNTRVVGPVPYAGDEVALFLALYRVQVDDLARKLLDVLSQIVRVFDVSKLSNYVDVADTLLDGLYSILNFRQLEYRIGYRDVFQDHAPKVFGDAYLAYINCDESAINADQLWVREGMLQTGASRDSLQPLREYDYCLVRIQSHETRNDYSTLPFHQRWKRPHNGSPMAIMLWLICFLLSVVS